MNNEEFERNIHFIVDQQAKFFSDIEALKEQQASHHVEFLNEMQVLKEQQAGTQKHLDYITKLVGVIGEKTLENTASIEQLSIEVRATSAEVRALSAEVRALSTEVRATSAEVRQTTINVNGLARMMGQHIGDANGHVQLEAEE